MLTNRPITPLLSIERYRAYASEIAYSILTAMLVVTPLEGTWALVFRGRSGRKALELAPLVNGNRLIFELDDATRAALPDDTYALELTRTLNSQELVIHRAAFAWAVKSTTGTDSVPIPPDLAINLVSVSEFEFIGQVYIPDIAPPPTFYEHIQNLASDSWTINHNLGYRPGGIMIFDSAHNQWFGEVTHLDTNVLTISFNGLSFSGYAYIS